MAGRLAVGLALVAMMSSAASAEPEPPAIAEPPADVERPPDVERPADVQPPPNVEQPEGRRVRTFRVVPTGLPLEQPLRRFMILGVGLGQVSRLSDVPPTDFSAWSFQYGQRLGRGFHLVEQAEVFSASGTGLEDYAAFSLGIRWRPFEPRPRWRPPNVVVPGRQDDWTALYVKANVGLGLRIRTDDEVVYAPVGVFALGYQPIQGVDWAFGFEVREQVARYDEGYQRGFSVLMTFQLSD